MRKWWRWIALLAAGAILAGGWWWTQANRRHAWPVLPVELGAVYRSGRLSPEQLALEIQKRNIQVVINLGSPAPEEAQLCNRLGIQYVELPVGDVWAMCGVPAPGQTAPSVADLSSLWSFLQQAQERPVLIHCDGGVHRTGVAVAMYRIRYQGWDAEDAIREMALFGFDIHKSKFAQVLDYLRHLEPGEARRASTTSAQRARR